MAVNSQKVLGIIFPNMHDEQIGEITRHRTTASVLFGARYRLIDFNLSMYVAAGIDDIIMPVRRNYISLVDHIGSGKDWDLSRKLGGIRIFPPFAREESGAIYYKDRLEALHTLETTIKSSSAETVVLSDCGIVSCVDLNDVLKTHRENECDVTVVYKKEKIDSSSINENVTFEIDKTGCVSNVFINDDDKGIVNNGMWIYVLKRELLLKMISDGIKRGYTSFEKEVLQRGINNLTICTYEYKGFLKRVTDLKTYFDANLSLLDPENIKELFSSYPIYTKVRDDAPVKYSLDSNVQNCVVADGCFIEGTVEKSMLFKGVTVGKNSYIKNCVLMQDTVIGDNVVLENIICDKSVVISNDSKLIGSATTPVYLPKKSVI